MYKFKIILISFETTFSYLFVGQIVFICSLAGLLIVKNYILFLLLLDLGIFSAVYNFLIFNNNIYSFIYTLFLLVLITVDTVIGLSLILIMDRIFKNTTIHQTSRFL